jgi:hypothetical protein
MRKLIGRVSELDPSAAGALAVITHFDALLESNATIDDIVKSAGILARCRVRLVDGDGRLRSSYGDNSPAPLDLADVEINEDDDTRWISHDVGNATRLCLSLGFVEGSESEADFKEVVLERSAGTIRALIERTRRTVGPSDRLDPALVELVVDPMAEAHLRLRAARQLGISPKLDARAIRVANQTPLVVTATDTAAVLGHLAVGTQVGVGPATGVTDLPRSMKLANDAFEFSAAGTSDDPGEAVVFAEELGGLIILADVVRRGMPRHVDVEALERASAMAPWVLETFWAVVSTRSLREAAARLTIHHSTLQTRLTRSQRPLGWDPTNAPGRLRLMTAIYLRRLERTAARAGKPTSEAASSLQYGGRVSSWD